MLVISRQTGRSVVLVKEGRELARITVLAVGGQVRLGFEAEDDVTILRSELTDVGKRAKLLAASAPATRRPTEKGLAENFAASWKKGA